MADIDWFKVKTEYITTNLGQRALCLKYNIPAATLSRYAKKERWVDERKKYRSSVIAKSLRKSANKESSILVKELKIASKISAILEQALNDTMQFNRYVVNEGAGDGYSEVSEKTFDKFDMKALKQAAETLRIVEGMKMRMNNMISEEDRLKNQLEKEKIKIARERLEIDRTKAGIDGDDDGSTGVVELPARIQTEEELPEDLEPDEDDEEADD